MTKLRPPLTPYRALTEIAAQLGWDGCGSVLGKSESLMRKWGDPDAEREISFQDAIRLDAAYLRAGGGRAPLLECYAARLDLDADEREDQEQLLAATSKAAKEAGEAVGAALDAAAKSSDPAMRAKAVLEAKEGIEALHGLLFSLQRTGPTASGRND